MAEKTESTLHIQGIFRLKLNLKRQKDKSMSWLAFFLRHCCNSIGTMWADCSGSSERGGGEKRESVEVEVDLALTERATGLGY